MAVRQVSLFLWNYCGGPAYSALSTGITGLLCWIPFSRLYQKDKQKRELRQKISTFNKKVHVDALNNNSPVKSRTFCKRFVQRRLSVIDGLILLFMGIAVGVYGNLFLSVIIQFFGSVLPESWSGQAIGLYIAYGRFSFLVLWLVIAAPAAEEMLFRWLVYLRMRDHMSWKLAAVFSGLAFGVFHGDVLQGIYAFILGILFAVILEKTGSLMSSILMHAGANLFSVTLSKYYEEAVTIFGGTGFLVIYALLLAILVFGFRYFKEG